MTHVTTYGVDIAKNVFQVHWVDADSHKPCQRKLSRAKLTDFFAQRLPGCVAMEACGGAHHWARTLQALGHAVQLLPARRVRAFVCGNKDDAADARAIWLASQQSDLRRVPVKSGEQQAVLSLHRLRSHWICVRTATINVMRGLLYEFGVVLPQGREKGLAYLAQCRARINEQVPALMVQMMDDQLRALDEVAKQVKALDAQIAAAQQASPAAQRLRQAPGIGPLGATALAAELGDGRAWRNGREFATCLGLVPSHTGTGGKVRMGGISKRGNAYLRTLLINGARSLVMSSHPAAWIARLKERRPFNVVVVAVAHKQARLAWALVTHGRDYDAGWSSQPPEPPGAHRSSEAH